MCRSEKSFSVLCGCADGGGGGRTGKATGAWASVALVMARNDSNREAVTRDAERQIRGCRIFWDHVETLSGKLRC